MLTAARAAFAVEGPSVSLDDIARRAGVGAGTVHRHFPTKDELFKAVIADRLHELTTAARELAYATEPGEAFFAFFHQLSAAARHNLALSAALASPVNTDNAVLDAGATLNDAVADLLARAQATGAVRSDIDAADLHAIIAGALAMEERLTPGSQGRGLAVIVDGLRG
ncbi:TetR family transcriptional regulator [Streptomyces sp. FXJ1.172]|uniref:TetR/AcrR family transcriptional regulator n=1 Tax=Streptomyces sp. FXJ1.172 TaxID=710705 RepID=UPI001F2CED00|nr:TetR/AcrR family transcriptional regulator [Streptomyces sp. FXJ1.172]WEO92928.1 TetR family transcriptional regulator [Streptomyces sp. FXJ1.172]